MLSQKQIGILGTGAYVPEAILTNQDLEKLVATSAEWIVERSGIHERRIAAPEEDTVTMAVLAGRPALADAGIEPGVAVQQREVLPDVGVGGAAAVVGREQVRQHARPPPT